MTACMYLHSLCILMSHVDWSLSAFLPLVSYTSHILLHLMGFPGGSHDKESAYNVGDPGSIPGSGRTPGKGNSYPLWYSCLVGHSPQGCKELGTIERLTLSFSFYLINSDIRKCMGLGARGNDV